MDKWKKVFEALPKINTIWVTKDGHFHLHNHYGGDEITREQVYLVPEKTKVQPRPKGHLKKTK
jgi:hypothetical protein